MESQEPMGSEASLAQRVLEGLANEAKARLSTADLITHAGERGRAREDILKSFFRAIVPAGFDLETGFIIDTHGSQSLQQDLIIVRHDYHPVFQVGGVKFFPAEAVAAVIEVKSSLGGQTLKEALRNSASVKCLDRTSSGSNYIVVGGAGGTATVPVDADMHEHQILSLIVAAKSSATRETLARHVNEHLAGLPRREWPNFVTIAGEFCIAYNSEIRSNQMEAIGLRYWDPNSGPGNLEPLVDLALELWSFLRVAPLVDVRPFRYVPPSIYGQDIAFKDGD